LDNCIDTSTDQQFAPFIGNRRQRNRIYIHSTFRSISYP
jgi:hypothetical protein